MKSQIYRYISLLPGRLVLWLLIASVALSMLAVYSSPVTDVAVADYAVFRNMGLSWALGGVPYVDMTDIKGPLFFWFQMLGQTMDTGKWPLFIFEIILLVVSAELFYRILLTPGCSVRRGLLLTSGMVLLTAALVEGGNSVEEYSLPLELLTMLPAARYVSGRRVNLVLAGLLTGLCAGCVAMIRVNNNAIALGMCVGWAIVLLREGRVRELVVSMGAVAGGFVSAVLPWVVYLASKGALDEAWRAVYGLSWQYYARWHGAGGGQPRIYQLMVLMTVSGMLLMVTSRRETMRRMAMYAVPAAVLSLGVLYGGSYYAHYMVMLVPTAVIGWAAADGGLRRVGVVLMAVSTLAVAVRVAILHRGNVVVPGVTCYHQGYSDTIVSCIPAGERGSVYIYGDIRLADVVHDSGHVPVGRYINMQDSYAELSDEVSADILAAFEAACPRWIVTTSATPLESARPINEHAGRYELRDSIVLPRYTVLLYSLMP